MTATSFETGEPATGDEILAALERLHTQCDRYLSGFSGEVFAAPQGEKWSPADHVRHLAKSVRAVARGLEMPQWLLLLRFGWHRGGSRSFSKVVAIYHAQLTAGATAGRFTPSAQPAPTDPDAWREEVLARWRQASVQLHAQIPRWGEGALDRIRLPHPVLGKLTVREMLFFTLYHNAHHVRRVAERAAV